MVPERYTNIIIVTFNCLSMNLTTALHRNIFHFMIDLKRNFGYYFFIQFLLTKVSLMLLVFKFRNWLFSEFLINIPSDSLSARQVTKLLQNTVCQQHSVYLCRSPHYIGNRNMEDCQRYSMKWNTHADQEPIQNWRKYLLMPPTWDSFGSLVG